jgi:hypothetical protein
VNGANVRIERAGTVNYCGEDGLRRLTKTVGHDNGRRALRPPAIALRYLWLGG